MNRVNLQTISVGADNKFTVSPFHKLLTLKSRFAIRTFDKISRFTDWKNGKYKKQCKIISAAFPDKMRERSATRAAMLFGCTFRAGNAVFCADD